MKTITNHLGQIILSVAAIALVVGVVLSFGGTIFGFFDGVTGKLSDLATGEAIWNVGGTNGSDSSSTTQTLEGSGQVYYTLAPTALSFRSTAPLSEFQEVTLNGETVDPSNYTLTEGSTIVTFSIEYLKTLPDDTYEVNVVSENSSSDGYFLVASPEANEHGFYYNQPYTAYVSAFGENESFFIREDGTMDIIGTPSGSVSDATYTIEGNVLTVVSTVAGTLTGTVSADGKSIYCNELATTFELSSDTSIATDEDYIYIYNEELGGYEVKVIDKTKASYGAIKTGVNGIDTVGIANNAFQLCTSLKEITIPASVTTIDTAAFDSCTNLTSITFAEGSQLTTIGQQAFQLCTSLKEITIPASVTTIGDGAFNSCTSLESIEIPASVTSMNGGVFCNCTSLDTITFAGTMAQWNTISKVPNGSITWNYNVPATYVQCSDGTVTLE